KSLKWGKLKSVVEAKRGTSKLSRAIKLKRVIAAKRGTSKLSRAIKPKSVIATKRGSSKSLKWGKLKSVVEAKRGNYKTNDHSKHSEISIKQISVKRSENAIENKRYEYI